MDTIVLDIETKNTFEQVGGRINFDKLEISVVGTYSYQKDRYYCFGENELGELKEWLAEPKVLVGFCSNKFDLPLLNLHLGLNLFDYPRIDLLAEIEIRTGRLISLDNLSKLNLKTGKTGTSIMAPELYKQGKIKELKEYCLNDVKLTKNLFDLAKKQNYLLVFDKNKSEVEKAELRFSPIF
jgi:DEAD/DEAH box helicase domain-containing protein